DIAAIAPESILGSGNTTTSVIGSLTLPSAGPNGSAISWASDKPAVISNNGQTIVRPVFGSGNTIVILTATVTKGAITETKTITLIVPELPNQAPTLNVIANLVLCYTTAA